jgi:hypothetical protein
MSELLVAQLVALHLGALHGYEKLAVLLVAFGPFVVLWFVVRYAQRRAAAEDEHEDLSGRPPAT